MRLLLDSHAFLWLAMDDARLSTRARAALTDADAEIYLSAATIWELTIKESKLKLKLKIPLERIVEDGVMEFGIRYLSVEPKHAHHVGTLPWHHQDPFDRMLIAQAHAEGLHLVTNDSLLAAYAVPIVW